MAVIIGLLVYFMTKNYWAALRNRCGSCSGMFYRLSCETGLVRRKAETVLGVLNFSTHFRHLRKGLSVLLTFCISFPLLLSASSLTMQSGNKDAGVKEVQKNDVI